MDFEWGQITVVGILGLLVGAFIGHRLALGRDRRREFVEAAKQFTESFVELKRLLALRHPNHIGGGEFQKTWKLLPKHYNAAVQAKIRFEPFLSPFKRRGFQRAWDDLWCVAGNPKAPSLDSYKSSEDHMDELAKRDLAIKRIDCILKFAR